MDTFVARKIRGLMGEYQVTQQQLAEVLGLTQGPVSERLNCRISFSVTELDTIAAYFDVPITALFPEPSTRHGSSGKPAGQLAAAVT
jgi:transcriptional regulator with XRE-family HTH domain